MFLTALHDNPVQSDGRGGRKANAVVDAKVFGIGGWLPNGNVTGESVVGFAWNTGLDSALERRRWVRGRALVVMAGGRVVGLQSIVFILSMMIVSSVVVVGRGSGGDRLFTDRRSSALV